jgi:hypothetical protein
VTNSRISIHLKEMGVRLALKKNEHRRTTRGNRVSVRPWWQVHVSQPWAALGVFPCMPWNTQDLENKHKYIYVIRTGITCIVATCCKSGPKPNRKQRLLTRQSKKKRSHHFLADVPISQLASYRTAPHRIKALRKKLPTPCPGSSGRRAATTG